MKKWTISILLDQPPPDDENDTIEDILNEPISCHIALKTTGEDVQEVYEKIKNYFDTDLNGFCFFNEEPVGFKLVFVPLSRIVTLTVTQDII